MILGINPFAIVGFIMDKAGQRPNEAPNPDQPTEKLLRTNTKDPIDTMSKPPRCSMCSKHLSGENALLPDRVNFVTNEDFQEHIDQLGAHLPLKNKSLADYLCVILNLSYSLLSLF